MSVSRGELGRPSQPFAARCLSFGLGEVSRPRQRRCKREVSDRDGPQARPAGLPRIPDRLAPPSHGAGCASLLGVDRGE